MDGSREAAGEARVERSGGAALPVEIRGGRLDSLAADPAAVHWVRASVGQSRRARRVAAAAYGPGEQRLGTAERGGPEGPLGLWGVLESPMASFVPFWSVKRESG